MDLSDKEELMWLAVLMADIRKALPTYEPLVVGAVARDLLLHHGYGVALDRATEDIDLAYAVVDWDEFNSLRDALVTSQEFKPGKPKIHRLIHRSNVPIDLIPFGGVERPVGSITWPNNGSIMGVLGYREARESAVRISLPQEQTLLTVSLPMLVVLKLLTWSDRHKRAPQKDASDLFLVLRNYLRGKNAERLYEEAEHLLSKDDFDYDRAGAWLAGHDARSSIIKYGEDPTRVLDVVKEILNAQIDPENRLQLVGETGASAERNLGLLTSFSVGLNSTENENQ